MITHVILDRDGVINQDSADYIKTPDEWVPIPGSLEAIALLSQSMPVFVATNQAGVGRGLFSEETLRGIHQKMLRAIENKGGKISDLVYCPHHPDEDCDCRKPKPGLLLDLARRNQFDLNQAIYIGDSVKDVVAAETAGCTPALVLTGNGVASARERQDVVVANDLAEWSTRLIAK